MIIRTSCATTGTPSPATACSGDCQTAECGYWECAIENFAIITGHYADVFMTVTNNSLNSASCDGWIGLQEYDPALVVTSTDVPGAIETFTSGETKYYTAAVHANTPADGTIKRHVEIVVGQEFSACDGEADVYIIPGWERSISKGWNSAVPTWQMYRGQLRPLSTSWADVHVNEYFVPSEGSDRCHQDGGYYTTPITAPPSTYYDPDNDWVVQSDNKWGPLTPTLSLVKIRDNIGTNIYSEFDAATGTDTVRNPVLGWYRADTALMSNSQRAAIAAGVSPNTVPEPCTITWQQHMVMPASTMPAIGSTQAGWVEYDVNEIVLTIDTTTFEVSRAGESSGVLTWP